MTTDHVLELERDLRAAVAAGDEKQIEKINSKIDNAKALLARDAEHAARRAQAERVVNTKSLIRPRPGLVGSAKIWQQMS